MGFLIYKSFVMLFSYICKKANMSRLNFFINGTLLIDPPAEWQQTEITVNWDSPMASSEITDNTFTFYNAAYKMLLDHYNAGNIFLVPQFKIEIADETTGKVTGVFDGYIDTRTDFLIDEENSRIRATVKKHNITQSLDVMLSGLTFGYLKSIGKTQKDYENFTISVEKKFTDAEIASALLMEGMNAFAIANVIRSAAETVGTIAALIATGITGSIAAIIYTVAVGVLELVYDAYVIHTMSDTINRINESLKIKQFSALAISAYEGITTAITTLGYTFETDIEELYYTYYIPSAIKMYDFSMLGIEVTVQEKEDGLPNENDYGYKCNEFFKLWADMFQAKFAVFGKKVVFYSITSKKWLEKSSYKMPDVLQPQKKPNVSDCVVTKLVTYATDSNNAHSVGFWRGTSAARETLLNNSILNEKGIIKSAVIGYNEVKINAALATTVPFDFFVTSSIQILNKTIQAIDKAINAYGEAYAQAKKDSDTQANGVGIFPQKEPIETPNFEGEFQYVDEVEGDVKKEKSFKIVVSDQFYSIPQIVYCKNKGMNYKHETPISAKNLLVNFMKGDSFVQKNDKNVVFGQYEVCENVTIHFSFSDFEKIVQCNHFTDSKGFEVIAKSINWNIKSDTASISYMRRKTYAQNLKENIYEKLSESDLYK